ncbi:MAG: capsular polysaccharide biosynthesis protein [Pseudomonadota bacterium]
MARNGKRSEPELRRVATTSFGLAGQRRDIQALLDCGTVFRPFGGRNVDAYVGWGLRPSGRRARRLAQRQRCAAIAFEDGFLKGYLPGLREPCHSYVVDRSGIYFDTAHPNDLETILSDANYAIDELDDGRRLMDWLRSERLTKYSGLECLGLVKAGVPAGKPFVVVVDQIAHDASIGGSGAERSAFREMLKAAADNHPGANIIVRSHPLARNKSPAIAAATALQLDIIVPRPMNPWPLIEEADAVYTISSLLGFEALIARKPVHAFGHSFYACRGLTNDHFRHACQKEYRSLAHVFLAAYRDYARYLDLHTRRPCTFEQAIEQMICVRNQRQRHRRKIQTLRFSPWKRRATEALLIGAKGRPKHSLTVASVLPSKKREENTLAVWGMPDGKLGDAADLMIEDGFVRSSGLGAELSYPCSLTIDTLRPYYDGRGPSDLEKLLAETDFDRRMLDRSARLRKKLVTLGVTKYNVGTAFSPPNVPEDALRILVPGQVEADASIRFGAREIHTNGSLVEEVRRLFPRAFIVYKLHPDAATGLRSAGSEPTGQNYTAKDGRIEDWIGWCNRLETMTSLAGFEALLRGKPVGSHGAPFYAGWGLTDDRVAIDRRSRKLTIDELVAGALIMYPLYVHPISRLPCEIETLVDALAEQRLLGRRRSPDLIWELSMLANRVAIRIRDTLRARRR